MRHFSKITILLVALGTFTACGKVGLENAAQGNATELAAESDLQETPQVPEVTPAAGNEEPPGSSIGNANDLQEELENGELVSVSNCDDLDENDFSCFLLVDSFERASIDQSILRGGFGWGSLVDDVAGSNGEQVEVAIYNDSQLGATPAAITGAAGDMGRSLVFTGRPGGSVHSIYLVSKPLDLSGFNSVFVAFDYLAIGLEGWSWNGATGNEHIRLEVCEADLTACGVMPSLSRNGLISNNWVTRYENAPNSGQGLTGHNHLLSDWQRATVDIDISSFSAAAKQNFVFRITVLIDEGFINTNIAGNLEDGIALDNVVALASKVEIE